MSNLAQFYLNSATSVKELDLLEISHPSWSKVYRIVRNMPGGVTVTHEDGEVCSYDYYPLKITGIAANQTLDQSLQCQLGDLGTVLPKELDAVIAAGTNGVRPTVKYRTYASNNLLSPLDGPQILEIVNLPFNSDGVSFEATAPSVDGNKTGETYTIDRFPMLRGFLT